MNLFQRWVIDAFVLSHRQSRHIERKIDALMQHLGASLPKELIQAGHDLSEKSKALRAALEGAQAQQQPTQKEK